MGGQGGVKKQESRAFTPQYLAGREIDFEEDVKVMDAVSIAMGLEPSSNEYKVECRKMLEERYNVCVRCPEYDLAVWGHKEVV